MYGDIVGGDVYNTTTVQIAQQVNHFYSAPPAQLARHAPPPHAVSAAPPLTLGQKKVLALMKPLPKDLRIKVLEFMRSQFGTAMVRELEPHALAKVHLHVLSVGIKQAREQRSD